MDLSFADAAIQIMCRLFCSYQNMQWHHMAQLYKPRVMQSSETTSANCAWSQDRPLIVHQSIELTMLAMAMQQRVIIPVGSSCCGELKALPANDPVYGSWQPHAMPLQSPTCKHSGAAQHAHTAQQSVFSIFQRRMQVTPSPYTETQGPA